MSSLDVDSESILAVARQLALAGFTIPWTTERKMNPNIDVQDMACIRKTPQGNSKRNEEQNEESQEDCKGQCWCWVKVSWRLDNRRSKDSAVTVSVVTVQIFHETINKLRTFT